MGSIVAELAEKLTSATNSFDIDEQTLYVNTSADTVGIGTNSPDGKLSVHQSGTDDIFNLYDGTTNILTVADGGTLTHKGTLLVGVDDTGHDVKFFGATSGKYMLWDESADSLIVEGNVGIGSTSPSTTLDVDGEITVKSKIHAFAGTSLTLQSGTSSAVIVNTNGANERVRIDSAGRVGIGTSAPKSDALLHVKTSTDSVNLLVESTEAGAAISGFGINMYRNSASAADNDNIAALRYIGKNDAGTPEDVTYGAMYGQIIDASDGTEDGALHIQSMKAGTLTTTMSVNAGKVGVGTTNPYGAFNVSDSGGFTTLVITDPTENASGEHWYFRNTGGNFYIGQSTDGTGAWDSLQARVSFLDGGKVGIGGTPSYYKMEVSSSNTDGIAIKTFSTTSTHAPELNFVKSNNGTIGTQTETTSGHILGQINFYGVDTTSSLESGSQIIAQQTGAAGSAALHSDLRFRTSDGTTPRQERMIILSNGNVGIASTAPTQKLDVGGTAKASKIVGRGEQESSSGYQGDTFCVEGVNTSNQATMHGAVFASKHTSSFNLICGTHDATYANFRVKADGGVYMNNLSTGSNAGNLFINSNNGLINRQTSSRRYKTNIVDSVKGLTELLTLRPVDFNSNLPDEDPDELHTGFIAEEVAEAGFEEYVIRGKDEQIESVQYSVMIALCVNAIKELSAKVTALEGA